MQHSFNKPIALFIEQSLIPVCVELKNNTLFRTSETNTLFMFSEHSLAVTCINVYLTFPHLFALQPGTKMNYSDYMS